MFNDPTLRKGWLYAEFKSTAAPGACNQPARVDSSTSPPYLPSEESLTHGPGGFQTMENHNALSMSWIVTKSHFLFVSLKV